MRGPVVRIGGLFDEALAAALARPFRAGVTVLASAVGIAALLATLGVAQSATAHLLARFDTVAMLEVTVSPVEPADGGRDQDPVTRDPEEELLRLRGVKAVGSLSTIRREDLQVATLPAGTLNRRARQIEIVAASSGLLEAVRGQIGHGRWFDVGHDARADRVAVLGARAAERLGIASLELQPVIFIGGQPFLVIGILEGAAREGDLLSSVVIPRTTGQDRFGLATTDRVVIETDPGAASLIAEQAPQVLAPEAPERLRSRVAQDLSDLRESATRDVNDLHAMLGLVALAIGVFAIANSTLVSVYERSGEISLRRALGATPRLIVVQVLIESTVLGGIGGLVGSALGTVAVVVAAVVQGWVPVLDASLVVVSPLVGVAVGIVAGIYPALRAGRMEPVDGLRQGV